MGKKCISILACEPGDIIAQKVVSKYGATIVVENTTVNSYIKNKLLAFEIDFVWIYGFAKEESINHKDLNFSKLKNTYNKHVLEIKEILNDLAMGNKVTVEKLNSISNSIYDSVNNEYYVVRYLNELKSTDGNTFTHSINVSLYAMLLGKWLLLTESKIEDILHAALLHDIGKMKFSNLLLNKKDALSISDIEEIQKHPIYGFNIIKDMEGITDDCKQAVLTHHLREDKSGYPRSAADFEPTIIDKIIALTNYYDSLTSERFYRKKITPFEAFHVIQSQVVTKFDIHIVNTFLSNLATCFVGTKVLLNSNQIGEIVYMPPQDITKPIISVSSNYLDLSKEPSLRIVNVL